MRHFYVKWALSILIYKVSNRIDNFEIEELRNESAVKTGSLGEKNAPNLVKLTTILRFTSRKYLWAFNGETLFR